MPLQRRLWAVLVTPCDVNKEFNAFKEALSSFCFLTRMTLLFLRLAYNKRLESLLSSAFKIVGSDPNLHRLASHRSEVKQASPALLLN